MPRLTVRTELEIDADAGRIWQLIRDFESYPRWNPSIRRARGRLAQGAVIDLWTAMMPVGPNVHVRAEVLEVEAPRRLRWVGTFLAPWVFTGEHRFILHPLEDGGNLLVQEETFRGLLVLALAPYLRWRITRLFEQTSRALKELAEPHGIPAGGPPAKRPLNAYAGSRR